MLWQIQLHFMLFGLNPSPTSPHWKGSHALLFVYPIITYYLVLVSLPYRRASKVVTMYYVSQSTFLKHCVASPWAAFDVVFSKYTSCLENYFWFECKTRNGQETSLLSLSSSRLRCKGDFAVERNFRRSFSIPDWTRLLTRHTPSFTMADIFLKRQDWKCWYYQATQNTTEFLHLYFCLRVTTVRYFSGFYA